MAESKCAFGAHDNSQAKDSTLSNLHECDRQITAFKLTIRNKVREQNHLEQSVKKLEENKTALLALQPKLQENILELAKTISTSDTDCLRIKNKLPYLSCRAIVDNISRLELQLRCHNYRPREEELVLKEICKLRNSLPLVEVYRERLQGNRALRNEKMRMVSKRNWNFEQLQKMHATLVAEADKLNQTKKLMKESEQGLEDVLTRKDDLIEVAKKKLQKRQKRRQQKKILEQSRPPDLQAARAESTTALKRSAPPVKRDAFTLELAACRFLLRYSSSLGATTEGGTTAPTSSGTEDSIPCSASTNKTAVYCGAEENKITEIGVNNALLRGCVNDEVTNSERDTDAPGLTCREKAVLATSLATNADKGGKYYCKPKEQENCSVQTKPKTRGHRERKAKKAIGHPPEIVVHFMELGIAIPKTLGDVPAAISNIEQKLNYYELLSEQVYYEKVTAQRRAEAVFSYDGNSGSSFDACKSTSTQERNKQNVPVSLPLAYSSSSLPTDAAHNYQLDFRERDSNDFPAMVGDKNVHDSNCHDLMLGNLFPVGDPDCEDSFQLGLLCPLQAELKSYCDVTKCSLEPVHSLPSLASLDLPDDPVSSVPNISNLQSSFSLSDDVFSTASDPAGSLSCVYTSSASSPSISCTVNSTTLTVSVASYHMPPSVAVSVSPHPVNATAAHLKCSTPKISHRIMDSSTGDEGAESHVNPSTTDHERSTSDVLEEKATPIERSQAVSNFVDIGHWNNNSNVQGSVFVVKDTRPDDALQIPRFNSTVSIEKSSDITNNNNITLSTIISPIDEDGVDTVADVVGGCPVTQQNDYESDVESGVCYDDEEPRQLASPTTETSSLLEDVIDRHGTSSSLDAVSEGCGLVSSSISTASSDSGVVVVSSSYVTDCDPTCSTDSSKSTSSGCSSNCNIVNANDDGSDWSSGDAGVQQNISIDKKDIRLCSVRYSQNVQWEETRPSSTSAFNVIKTISSASPVSDALEPQPICATLTASEPSYTAPLQHKNCASVPDGVSCSVVKHANFNERSPSTDCSSQPLSARKSLGQTALPIPTINIAETESTITGDHPPHVIDQIPARRISIERRKCSFADLGKKQIVPAKSLDGSSTSWNVEFASFGGAEEMILASSCDTDTCEQPSITMHHAYSALTPLTCSRSGVPRTPSLNCSDLSPGSLPPTSSAVQSALLLPPTPPITIGGQCNKEAISTAAPSSTLQVNQLLPPPPAPSASLGTSPSSGFCALSPAHVSAQSQSRQETALVSSYADIAKSSVPRK